MQRTHRASPAVQTVLNMPTILKASLDLYHVNLVTTGTQQKSIIKSDLWCKPGLMVPSAVQIGVCCRPVVDASSVIRNS